MTNGEKIKEIFPNINIYEHGSTYSINNEYNFNASWWDAEYIEPTTKIDLVVRQLREEADYAYADFDKYKAETLGADADELPDDDFRYGLERAIEVIKAADKEQK